MKATRIIAIVAVLTLIACGSFYFYASAQTQNTPADTSVAANSTSAATPVKVTVADISTNSGSWLELLGTVKANDQIKVFATAAGQLQQPLVEEGAKVKQGDPLFYIGGINGTKPATLIQLEMARTNYENAQKGMDLTVTGNSASLKVAQLQLESAKHQTAASQLDMQIMDQNLNGSKTGLNFLQDSYNTTMDKNSMDVEKAQNGIEDLKNSINNLENSKYDLQRQMDDKLASTADSAARDTITAEMNAQIAAMDKSLDDLYQKLDDAKNGYKALLDGMTLGENQLLAQIQQAKTQGNVLYLTEQSTQNKLGLTDGSSDPQKIAEEGVAAVKIKNDAAILQTQAQLNLAKSNLELAGLQADSLIVRSPIDGTVGDILAHEGDLVGQQVMLAQIYGQRDFDLDVGVDSESADLITDNSKAEIMIGGRYIPVPIRNISPVADSLSKLVTVTLGLPKINFRINQSLRVRISINDNSGASISSVYVPLDAVIIATEEQYVYVLDGGKAVKKTVKTGEVSGDQIQILEGLSSSDKVIVDGAKSLIDGQEVTLQ